MEQEDDFMFDQVTGAKSKKSVFSTLNKKKIGKHELDEIFDEFY